MPGLRRFLRWILSAFAVCVVVPVVGDVAVQVAKRSPFYEHAPQRVEAAMNWLAAIAADPTYRLVASFIVGLTLGMWLDTLLRRREQGSGRVLANPPVSYTDTRLRLRLDPAGTGTLLQEQAINIHSWQQTCVRADFSGEDGTKQVFHSDTLSLTFEVPIPYSRPIINTFGHKLDIYNFYPLGTHGAVFQFAGNIQAGMLEIWFPPPGYYD